MKIVQGVDGLPGLHRIKALVGLAFGDDAVAVTAPELPPPPWDSEHLDENWRELPKDQHHGQVAAERTYARGRKKARVRDSFCQDLNTLRPVELKVGQDPPPMFPSGELVVAVFLQSDGHSMSIPLAPGSPRTLEMAAMALECAYGVLFTDFEQIRVHLFYTGVCEAAAQTVVIAAPFRGGE